MRKIGIVGNGTDKFTLLGEQRAKDAIREIIGSALASGQGHITVVSGHSPVGGVDIWAEEIVSEIQAYPQQTRPLNLDTDIKAPTQHSWSGTYGYKARNLDIARSSDIVYVIVADSYPPDYKGRKFKACYHCRTSDHVKSGACWTAKQAQKMGKEARWVVVCNQ